VDRMLDHLQKLLILRVGKQFGIVLLPLLRLDLLLPDDFDQRFLPARIGADELIEIDRSAELGIPVLAEADLIHSVLSVLVFRVRKLALVGQLANLLGLLSDDRPAPSGSHAATLILVLILVLVLILILVARAKTTHGVLHLF